MDEAEDLDLEDIEARLYSQVYHGVAEPEETADNLNFDESSAYYKKKYRYFDQKLGQSDPVLTQVVTLNEQQRDNTDNIKDCLYNFVQENNCNTNNPLFLETISPNTTTIISTPSSTATISTPLNTATISSSGSQDVIHNITVNQYSLPLIINPNYLSPADQVHINSLVNLPPIALDNPKVGQKKKRSRKKKNSKINRVLLSKNIKKGISTRILRSTVTIYVSDSDSDECVVLENMNNSQREINTKFPRKYTESEGGTPPEPDDDIIFVPPPPVEIINVEIDENEKPDLKEQVLEKIPMKELNYNPEEETELIETPESTFSNDFLDNSNLETNNANFNFSLHGSEFRSGPSEVVKSRKPTEYCETESSCSTNDQQSRDFSNTVKTIVFDEVEFPKEDIFSDKNLESFSSFITPKRSCSDKPNNVVSKSTIPLIENCEHISSGTSSSESDYESNVNSKSDTLPNLSPMVPNDNPKHPPKKSAQHFLKPLTKKAAVEEKESFDIIKKPGLPKNSKEKNDSENLKKKKNNDDETPTENLDEENTYVAYDQLEENCQSSTPNLKSKKKKKRVNSLLISQEETTNEKIPEVDQSSVTQESTANDSSIICISDTSILDKTKKKKKKREVTSKKDPADENEVTTEIGDDSLQLLQSNDIEDGCNSEKSKKKKKKRENSEINDQESAIDSFVKDLEITMDLSRNFGPKKKKKKKLKDGIDHEDKIKKRKERKNRKRKINELEENISQVTEGTSESQEAYDTPQSNSDSDIVQTQINAKASLSNSVVLIENEANSTNDFIVIDSDNSSDVELVLSTDTELDFEVLDDIGDDLSINCSTSKQKMEKVNVSNEDVDRVIEHARAPLEDCDQFDVEAIQNQQSNDPDKWKISFRDRGLMFNSKENRGPRCNRCRHFGHIGIRCPDKQHPQPCTLCGSPDHQEPRCPNKRCLQCGNPGEYSTTYCMQCFKFRNSLCMLCRMPGHVQKFCPDLWRRYHLTNDGPIVTSTAQPKPRNEQWCSGCAKRGHLEHECDYYNRQFPPTTPFIMNYYDVLKLRKTPQNNVNNPIVNSPPIVNQQIVHPPPIVNQQIVHPPPIVNQQIVHPPTLNMAPMGNATVVNPPLLNLPMVTPQIVNNMQNFIPPHGSNVPNLPTELNRKVIPHSSTHNMTIQVSNTPIPNDIVLQMMLNFNNPSSNSNDQSIMQNMHSNESFQNNQTNNQNITQNQFNNQPNQFRQPTSRKHNIDLNDEGQIENFIMRMPPRDVYDFIRDEMDYMKNSNIDPRVLKRKLIKYDRIDLSQRTLPPNLVRERNFWWRILNMVILGVNKHKDGRLHLIHLNRYLARGKRLNLDMHKRRSLLSSYLYIFGNKKRPNVNYYKIIRTITRQYSAPKIVIN